MDLLAGDGDMATQQRRRGSKSQPLFTSGVEHHSPSTQVECRLPFYIHCSLPLSQQVQPDDAGGLNVGQPGLVVDGVAGNGHLERSFPVLACLVHSKVTVVMQHLVDFQPRGLCHQAGFRGKAKEHSGPYVHQGFVWRAIRAALQVQFMCTAQVAEPQLWWLGGCGDDRRCGVGTGQGHEMWPGSPQW